MTAGPNDSTGGSILTQKAPGAAPSPAPDQNLDVLKASSKKNNASPIGAILVGATEFLEGAPKVKVKINAGQGLTFTAENELGQTYDFKATGQFDLDGTQQSAS